MFQFYICSQVNDMLQVVPVKNEAKEKKPKTKQTNRLANDSNNDTSSDNIQPNTKLETCTEQPSKDFVCNSATCSYKTVNLTNMHNHCISVHKTVRFVCDSNGCHKVYNSINGYTYHIKKHGIQKPLKCRFCTIYFNCEALLQEHEKFIWLLKSCMYVKCVIQGSQEAVMSTGISLHVSRILTLSNGARSVKDYSLGGTDS